MAEGGALRDLLARFSVEVDTKSLTSFEHGVTGVFERIQKYASIFAGMFALNALKEFVGETIESAAELKKLAGRLQVDTDEFQKVQKFLRASAEDTAMAITRLNRGIGTAKAGEKSPIEKLGISLKDAKGELKPTSELVLEMADKVAAMKTPAEKTAAVLDVFGRSAGGMIKPLSMGRKEAEKFFKEFEELGGVVSKDFVEKSVKAEHEMKKFKTVMGGLKRDAVSALLPTVLKVAEGLKNFALKIRGITSQTNAIEHFFKALKFGAIVSGIYKVVVAMRALSLATLTNPFTLLIVGAAALFLIVDDLWTLLEGGDSLIGDALGPDKVQFVANLKDAFDSLKEAISGLDPWLKSLGIDVGQITFDSLIEGLRNTAKGISVVIEYTESLVSAFKTIKGMFDITKAGSLEAGITAAVTSHIESGLGNGIKQAPAQTAVASVPMKQDNSVKVTNHNTFNTTVESGGTGADAPAKVGKAIGQGARSELDRQNVNALNAGKKK